MMNTLHRNLLKTLALALLLAAANAQAIPLSDLFAGASITAGDKLFDQFHLIFQDQSSGVTAANPAGIAVTPLNDGGSNPGPGLAFDTGTQFTVDGNGVYAYSDYSFGFRVSTPNGQPVIEDNLLKLVQGALVFTSNGTEDLGMSIVEKVFDAFGNQLAEKYVESSALGTPQTVTHIFEDHAAWTPALSEVFVEKNILVWSSGQDDIAQLVKFEQRFSQVPEPSTVLLFSLGFVGLGFTRKGHRV